MSTTATRYGSVIFGKSVLQDLLALGIAGSVFIGGYQFFDRAQTTTVRQYFGTGAYLFYDDAQFAQSGSTAYRTASIVNPLTTPLVVEQVAVECGTIAVNKAIPVDAGIRTSSQLNSSGSDVWNSRFAGTGSVLKHSTGSFIIAVGGSIRFTTASGSYPGISRCQARLWGNQQYTP